MLTHVWGVLARGEKLREWAERAARTDRTAQDLARLDAERGGIEVRRKRLTAALEDGAMDWPEIRSRAETLDARLREIVRERAEIARQKACTLPGGVETLRLAPWADLSQTRLRAALVSSLVGHILVAQVVVVGRAGQGQVSA